MTPGHPSHPVAPRAGKRPSWKAQIEKLTLASLDDDRLQVVAQYNPKELQFDKQLQWKKPDRVPGAHVPRDEDQDEVELTAKPSRSVSIELLFDGYEEHRSIRPELDKLEVLSSIRVPGSKYAPLRRPHHCVAVWGTTDARPFRCVIESLTIKLTMFAPSGVPLRAICTVKLTEVNVLSKMATP